MSMRAAAVSVFLAIGCLFATARSALEEALNEYIAGKEARIGVAVIAGGVDAVAINGGESFPMLSVYKFPQALAVADYCEKHSIAIGDTIAIRADEIRPDTWSPLREKYGVRNLRLPISELLAYTLQQSDNNACDVLFRLIGGPQATDSLMKAMGCNDISVVSTEEEMHRDISLCHLNHSTPLEMARLFDSFFRREARDGSDTHRYIAAMLRTCTTGKGRLSAPLAGTKAVIGHKTGTGDSDFRGRLIGVNDAGYICLSDGRGYAIAVFVADSPYSMAETESIIADISAIIFNALR